MTRMQKKQKKARMFKGAFCALLAIVLVVMLR